MAKPIGPYSPILQAGEWFITSGQIGLHDGELVSGGLEAELTQIFQNIKAILEDSGSNWENLIDVTVCLVNMKRAFATYNKVYAQYFKDNQPCRTTVEINALPTPIAIELKCIATI